MLFRKFCGIAALSSMLAVTGCFGGGKKENKDGKANTEEVADKDGKKAEDKDGKKSEEGKKAEGKGTDAASKDEKGKAVATEENLSTAELLVKRASVFYNKEEAKVRSLRQSVIVYSNVSSRRAERYAKAKIFGKDGIVKFDKSLDKTWAQFPRLKALNDVVKTIPGAYIQFFTNYAPEASKVRFNVKVPVTKENTEVVEALRAL